MSPPPGPTAFLYVDEVTVEVTKVQFKATADASVIRAFQREHPDVEVIQASPSEVARLADGRNDTLLTLRDGDLDASGYADGAAAAIAALAAAQIINDYWAGAIDPQEACSRLVAQLGSRAGSTAAKVYFLATPVAPAVVGWSVWRIVSSLWRLRGNTGAAHEQQGGIGSAPRIGPGSAS